MKNIKYISLLLIALFFTSCEEVVDVDLDTAAPRLVIDASINWYKGTAGNEQKIKLTTTAGYYDTVIPAISGAQVFITNSTNNVFTFIENPDTGEYSCTNFVPVLNETYTLTVISEGQTYTAVETMKATSVIKDNIAQNNEGGFSGSDIELKFFFQDNGAEDNYYMTRIAASIHPLAEYEVSDDEFFQGNEITGIYIDEDLKAGDIMQFSVYGISEQYKNYMTILLNASQGDGGPFQTTPSNARGNLINQTNSNNFALGYFRLSEVDTKTYTVQ
ncbi:MAG: DUF4249 domain-containing protein [Flavobacterium sp.]|nr:DUF4249 domain-containing protein [Flavobacterium sp.]